MKLSFINPALDSRWASLIETHPAATPFHTVEWAQVLMQTYDHAPHYSVAEDGCGVCSGWPLMEAASPIFGLRGVSLPFTDWCVPLLGSDSHQGVLLESILSLGRQRAWKYQECKGLEASSLEGQPSVYYYSHTLSLDAPEQSLFERVDGSVRRGIRKSMNSGVVAAIETTEESVRNYYQLHCLTRKRHGLPPQPWKFFGNIWSSLIRKGKGFVVLARKGQAIAAGALFLLHKSTAIYKYGASDFTFQQLRPNNLVMWTAIQHLSKLGARTLDFGRTSLANEGLRKFKQHWGSTEVRACYHRFCHKSGTFTAGADRAHAWYNGVFCRLPLWVSRILGGLLYPHMV